MYQKTKMLTMHKALNPTDDINRWYIVRSHNVYREYHGEQERGTDSKSKKLSWGKNPESDLPVKCAITITIRNSDDATQS